MWNARSPFLVVAGLLLASCGQGGSTTPRPSNGDVGETGGAAGLYVLRSLAGSPPPVVGNYAANLVVIADTIRLRAGGNGVETGEELVIDELLPQGEAKRQYERGFTYRLLEERLEIEFPCPSDALILCAAPPHYVGKVTQDGLEFDFALYYRTPLIFERVGD